MSHFSVCVIVPDDGVVNNIHANNLEDHLIPVLAPFDEQTEEEKYREFEDRTEEAKADFENDTMRVVRFPDGSIHSIYDDTFNKSFFIEEDRIYAFGPNRDRKSKLQTEESKALELVTDYPVKSWYSSFEAYCDEHRGFVKASDGRWGYTYNPNAKWDWWQIGGRFPNRFLVPAGLQDCIPSAKDDDGESAIPPEGYQYADAARKKDISEVPSGQKCNCICAACLQPFEARKGTRRRHHFAHVSNYECMYASEVAIYKAFAEALKQSGFLALPPVMLRFPAWNDPELLQEARRLKIDSVAFECEPPVLSTAAARDHARDTVKNPVGF